jgi:hypothetical protein
LGREQLGGDNVECVVACEMLPPIGRHGQLFSQHYLVIFGKKALALWNKNLHGPRARTWELQSYDCGMDSLLHHFANIYTVCNACSGYCDGLLEQCCPGNSEPVAVDLPLLVYGASKLCPCVA